MAISGSFMRTKATVQPMSAKPAPNNRHGQMTQPDNNWSAPPANVGGGAPWAEPVVPEMSARGIQTDSAHQYGHGATGVIRWARRPFLVSKRLGATEVDAQYDTQGSAQDASAKAHGDLMTRNLNGHHYDPVLQKFAGEEYTVDQGVVDEPTYVGARTAIHGTPGGQFLDGTGGEFRVTGARRSIPRRWAQARYSSPTLGAMYSKNTLRGILPQTATVPVTTPGLRGITDSGIPSNTRFLGKTFTTPALFRSPPSESEQQMANSSVTPTGDTMGVGF